MISTGGQPHNLRSGDSVDLDDFVWDGSTRGALANKPIFGSIVSNVPVSLISSTASAVKASSFLDNYYNHIWIIPSSLELGSVVSERHDTVEVWNSFFDDRDFTGITIVGDDAGVTLTGVPSGTLPALHSTIYDILVEVSGAGNIVVEYHWLFTGDGDTGSFLTLNGQRVIPFKLRHNWVETVLEQIAYKTQVLGGQSGKEQRIRLRDLPRRRIEMSYLTLTKEERMYLENIAQGHALTFAVPLWFDKAESASAITIGQRVFPVDTVNRDYEAGAYIFLRNGDTTEALQVESFTTTTVTTVEGAVNNYPAGATICPARFGHLESKIELSRITNHHESTRLAWLLDTNQHRANQLEAYTFATYRGLEIYATQNDYLQSQTLTQSQSEDIFDNETGLIGRLNHEPFPRRTYPFTTLIGRSELSKFLKWLDTRAGQLTPFWFLDFVPQFTLVDGVALDSIFMTVENNGYTQFSFGNPARRDIAINTSTGWVYRRVVASVDNHDGTETLTLDTAPGVALTVDEAPMMCYLRCVRLNSDTVEITYETIDTIIRTATEFIDLLSKP